MYYSATLCTVPDMSDKQSSFKVQPDTSRVLMSEILKGNVPELEGDGEEAPVDLNVGHVVVIATKRTAGSTQLSAIVGILRGVLFDVDPEIEFRVQLTEAMDIIETPGISFDGFELHHGERIIKIPGPYNVKTARIDEIAAAEQMCTLGLHLKKQAR